MFNEENLMKRLYPRPVKFFASVESTQNVAFDWLNTGAPSGAVVVADEQVAGRGRHGRGWVTPPGTAIAMSVILHPAVDALSQITMLGALAIAQTLDRLGVDGVAIKWPNDVQISGKKVSGVLPEAAWNGDSLRGVALGMGINVRVDFSDTELAQTATSIETALGQAVSRVEVVAGVLARIDALLALPGADDIFVAWKSRLATMGQTVTVMQAGDTLRGIAEDVAPDGALLLRRDDGVLVRVMAGDVTLAQQDK